VICNLRLTIGDWRSTIAKGRWITILERGCLLNEYNPEHVKNGLGSDLCVFHADGVFPFPGLRAKSFLEI
jgi:hypothetical protein